MLLIGTTEGIYRAPMDEIDDATRVLESKRVLRIREFSGAVFAATQSGLFRSTDDGATWTDLGVPRDEVYSVLVSPAGERLYAGTHPAHLYVSTDEGNSWRELEGLQDLPSREEWRLPRHRNEAHVRSLGAHPDAPERVIAGIEVGGVHVSDDSGDTWTERRDGLHDDVHPVLVQENDEFVASCGGGLYRTRDAGPVVDTPRRRCGSHLLPEVVCHWWAAIHSSGPFVTAIVGWRARPGCSAVRII